MLVVDLVEVLMEETPAMDSRFKPSTEMVYWVPAARSVKTLGSPV